MTDFPNTRGQLAALAELDEVLRCAAVDYWLFGGWAVDAHAGRVTRTHEDVDIAVWAAEAGRVAELLAARGWARRSEADEDGYTCFVRGAVQLDVAYLASGATGRVYTPLREGRGDWPDGAFGDDVAVLRGVRVRVIGRDALIVDKSATRSDPATAAKDRQDVAALTQRT
jgi:hypothetical protein